MTGKVTLGIRPAPATIRKDSKLYAREQLYAISYKHKNSLLSFKTQQAILLFAFPMNTKYFQIPFSYFSSIDVQCGQRVASSAISLLQNGQMRLGLTGADSGFL